MPCSARHPHSKAKEATKSLKNIEHSYILATVKKENPNRARYKSSHVRSAASSCDSSRASNLPTGGDFKADRGTVTTLSAMIQESRSKPLRRPVAIATRT